MKKNIWTQKSRSQRKKDVIYFDDQFSVDASSELMKRLGIRLYCQSVGSIHHSDGIQWDDAVLIFNSHTLYNIELISSLMVHYDEHWYDIHRKCYEECNLPPYEEMVDIFIDENMCTNCTYKEQYIPLLKQREALINQRMIELIDSCTPKLIQSVTTLKDYSYGIGLQITVPDTILTIENVQSVVDEWIMRQRVDFSHYKGMFSSEQVAAYKKRFTR